MRIGVLMNVRGTMLLLAAVALACVGCGGKMGSVTGKVTVEGQPVANASVTFEDGVKHIRASGVTDANGVYTLSTNAKNDGAPVGDYKVSVTQAGPEDSSQTTAPPRLFPPQFERAETSGLTTSVKSGSNTFDIQLPKP